MIKVTGVQTIDQQREPNGVRVPALKIKHFLALFGKKAAFLFAN